MARWLSLFLLLSVSHFSPLQALAMDDCESLMVPQNKEGILHFPESVEPWQLDDFLDYYALYVQTSGLGSAEFDRIFGIEQRGFRRNLERIDLNRLKNLPGAELIWQSFLNIDRPLPNVGELRQQYSRAVYIRSNRDKSIAARVLGLNRSAIYRFVGEEATKPKTAPRISEEIVKTSINSDSLITFPEGTQFWKVRDFLNLYAVFMIEKLKSPVAAAMALGVTAATIESCIEASEKQNLRGLPGAESIWKLFESLGENAPALAAMEERYILTVIVWANYDTLEAAKMLSISDGQLQRLIRKHPRLSDLLNRSESPTDADNASIPIAGKPRPLLPANIKPWTLKETLLLYVVHASIQLGTYESAAEALGIDATAVRDLVEDRQSNTVTLRPGAVEMRKAFEAMGTEFKRLETIRAMYISSVLNLCQNDRALAAKVLGMDLEAIYRFLERHSER